MPIYSAKDVKYYKYTYIDWEQPFLTEDGTVGGDSYACRCNQTYGSYYAHNAFDSNLNNQWVAPQSNDPTVWIEFYSPVLLKVSQLDITNVNSSYNTVWNRVEVFGSTDGETYFSFGEYNTNTAQNATWTVNIPEDKQRLTKYIKITGAPDSSMSRNDRCRLAFIKIFAKEAFAIESTKENYDYYVMPKIKQIVNPKYIKYYNYVYGDWTQPALTADGTVGGDNYAARISSRSHGYAWEIFDKSDSYWEAGTKDLNQWVEFYSPVMLKLTSATFTNRDSGTYVQSYTVWRLSCSNDGINYDIIKDFDLGSSAANGVWSTDFNMTDGYKYFRFSAGTGADFASTSSARPSFKEIELFGWQVAGSIESNKNDYDYRELNQIKEVYTNSSELIFTK